MSHYEPKWFHFHVFSGHFLKEHENKPLFQLTPTNIKCSQFLVLDTHGLKEANLHLAEQQEDQFKYKLCWKSLQVPFGNALQEEKGKVLGKSSQRGAKITWVAPKSPGWQLEQQLQFDQGRFVFQEKLCLLQVFVLGVLSRVSLRLEVQHIPPKHNGRGKGNNSVPTTAPHCEQSGEINHEIFPHSDGSFASSSYLGLAIQVRELIHDTHSGSQHKLSWKTAQEKQSQLLPPQLSRLVFHIPRSPTLTACPVQSL